MRLNDLNRVHVFSDFACGFRFLSKYTSVLRFFIISSTIFRFLRYSNAPLFLRNSHVSAQGNKSIAMAECPAPFFQFLDGTLAKDKSVAV